MKVTEGSSASQMTAAKVVDVMTRLPVTDKQPTRYLPIVQKWRNLQNCSAFKSQIVLKIFHGIIARRHHTDQRLMGIAERAVRRVKEGSSAVLLQSSLNENWWADSLECYTYLRNVTDLLSDGKTPYERRFGQPLEGPISPFGSLVEYHPITAKDQSRIHQFGKKVLPGLFLGYALYAGGIWKGDVLVADLEELDTMDASEIYSKRLNAKGSDISQTKRRIYFSNRRWTNQNFLGGYQDLRTSTLVRHRPIQGERSR